MPFTTSRPTPPGHARPARRRTAKGLAGLLVAAVAAAAALVATPTTALAATGDYGVELTGPESVVVRAGYSYTVTLDVEATSSDPAEGIVLTAALPPGIAFDSVPTGEASPVQSASYDAATRTVTFTMKSLTEPLTSFLFSVTQVDNLVKGPDTTLDVTLTGSATPGGGTPAATASTAVTGRYDYQVQSTVTPVSGTANRSVNYAINVQSLGAGDSDLFTSRGQRITTVLPAGAIVRGQSTGIGTWTLTPNGDGTTTAVWERTGAYGPSGDVLDSSRTGIWLAVDYPPAAFPMADGVPVATLGLDILDTTGAWLPQASATLQPPAFTGDAAIGKGVAIVTEADVFHHDSAAVLHSRWLANYVIAASYVNSVDADQLDELVVTDAAEAGPTSAEFFDHADHYYMNYAFNSTLKAAALPYSLEYTTTGNPSWQSFDLAGRTTAADVRLAVQATGSQGFANGYVPLNLPVGERLTGWRLTIGTGSGTVPTTSQVTATVQTAASYPSLSGTGTNATGPIVNTATASGSIAGVPVDPASDTATWTISDRVPLTTAITGPTSLAVGSTATYQARITNLDASGRSYADTLMKVVLPKGVYYDDAVGASLNAAASIPSPTPPAIGDGVTVSTETLTDGTGRQVVVFDFAVLESTRTPGQPKFSGNREAFVYDIPVRVLPQAYDPAAADVTAETWAYTLDPAYASTPVFFYPGFEKADVHDFSPTLTVIAGGASASQRVVTAGGLLLGTLTRADAGASWGLHASVASPGTAEWQFSVVNALPNPMTDVVLFDRLPAAGDDRGSQFGLTLGGPVTGAPAGAVVEYSTDATSATDGTWGTDPTGATAFRITVATVAAGESFALTVPTLVPAEARYQQLAVNDVEASAVYGGAAREFGSNTASIEAQAHPAVALVAKTNGLHYGDVPGALVAIGSELAWTYEVTNTGDVALDEVAVVDAYTAPDGTTGTLAATSGTTGPLLPGETRTFSATGTAAEGQYRNAATVTGLPVDGGDAVTATDTSAAFGGRSGLTVAVTTNEQDAASAPGVLVAPDSDVVWHYTVTNTGTTDLTDVLVRDVDADGEVVLEETVPFLAAGDSVTLTADGIAVTGQYHDTVTASSADPLGGQLTAADDSYYFGVVAGVSVAKTVSLDREGPFTATATAQPGDTVYWRVSVTNDGNTAVRDVTVSDPALDAERSIAVLEAGATETFLFVQEDVRASLRNVATAAVADGGEALAAEIPAVEGHADLTVEGTPGPTDPKAPTGDGGAGVVVTIPATPFTPVLPLTGVQLGGLLAAAAALLGLGGFLVIRSRRQRA